MTQATSNTDNTSKPVDPDSITLDHLINACFTTDGSSAIDNASYEENYDRELGESWVIVTSDSQPFIDVVKRGWLILTGEEIDDREADRLLFCDELSVSIYDSHDTSICCHCNANVIHASPYDGWPRGTIFSDGEGYVCSDCTSDNPGDALETELAHSHPYGTTFPDYLDLDEMPEGWAYAYVHDSTLHRIQEKMSDFIAWWLPLHHDMRTLATNTLIAFKRHSAGRR